MIRQPTSHAVAYAWHTAAMAGDEPVTTDEAQCGWFKRRLVKHGPFVPARIWLDQPVDLGTDELIDDERLLCELNGQRVDAEDQWPWLCANPISESEFNYLTASLMWSATYAPDEPRANPRQPIDWLKVPVPTFI